MPGLWYEEFHVGQTFDHPITRSVTEADNMLFSNMTLNPQPLHIDANYAAATEYGKPLVNSLFTLGLMIGISVHDTTLRTTIANLGMSEVNFPAPVFPGDSIRVVTTVQALRESRSRPTAGLVTFRHQAFNQHGVEVANCVRLALMRKRPPAGG